jgi:hypothetical protein
VINTRARSVQRLAVLARLPHHVLRANQRTRSIRDGCESSESTQ